MSLSVDDIKTLVQLVGRDGAVAALVGSKTITQRVLSGLGKHAGIEMRAKDSKKELAQRLVRHIDRRIDKTVDELKGMTKEGIARYLEQTECDSEELLEFLENIDIAARTSFSRKALIEFAAIQISSLGVFERLSTD